MEEEKYELEPNQEDGDGKSPEENQGEHRTVHLSGMYQNWFMDYASYVILERAVPDMDDGLKPVQRRILHAMKELDDGRFNKVANIIGHTMKYHPHGDASIGDALVQLGQKDLLVDTQGNWGNIHTGDSSAAPRYIEARLSKFALDVAFSPKITKWKSSYDGRNKEPVTLPVKFPLLLAQGVEGIAVGLASKILPHNFNELIDASIAILKEEDFEIYPDFPTGGLMDATRYNDGLRGGRVRVRARIRKEDKKTLVITDIPFGLTTTSLIDSIITANDKRKIKIRKIDDNTSENVEIVVNLAPGVSPDQTIDALYAFTQCEVSISPNACVIHDGKPAFLDVKTMLRHNTGQTLDLLKKELEIRMNELKEELHFATLEQIFIEEKIYRKIETATTWEAVMETIRKGLKPFSDRFIRDITDDDIVRLTEIRIKRISKFNSMQAEENIARINSSIEEVQNHLDHLVDYAITYYRQIKKKYGKGRERKTELRNFDTIEATMVAAASEKLYLNREEGFAGTSLKRDDYICDCSDIDDIIVFRADGTMMVTKVEGKFHVGKDIVHIAVFKRNDDRTIYNMIYRDGKKGSYFVKRFAVTGVTRDKEYNLTRGSEGSRVVYFTANPNGEAETLKIYFRPKPRMKKTSMEFDFSTIAIKGRGANGNILTKNPIKSIVKREEGVSTLGALDIWYDDTVRRLNTEERGKYLGAFKEHDKIIVFTQSGLFRTYGYELTTHFDFEDIILIEKFSADKVYTVIYTDGETGFHYVKRFTAEISDKPAGFLNDQAGSLLTELITDKYPRAVLSLEDRKDGKPRENEEVEFFNFIAVKGFKAKGKRIANVVITKIELMEPLPEEEEETVESDGEIQEPGKQIGVDELSEEDTDNGETGEQEDYQDDQKPLETKDPRGNQIELEF